MFIYIIFYNFCKYTMSVALFLLFIWFDTRSAVVQHRVEENNFS
jgi:hypothetical protein